MIRGERAPEAIICSTSLGLAPVTPNGEISHKEDSDLVPEGAPAIAQSEYADIYTRSTRNKEKFEELQKAAAEGKGAAALDGKMIDAASERMARNVIVVADAIAAATA